MVAALVLGASAFRRASSSLALGTIHLEPTVLKSVWDINLLNKQLNENRINRSIFNTKRN